MNAQDFWIYYQLLVAAGTLIIAFMSVIFTLATLGFLKKILEELQEIRRSTSVLKVDTLLRVKRERKKS
jgi:hypothetical protein